MDIKKHIHYEPDTGKFTRIGHYTRWGFKKVNRPLEKISKEGYLIISIENKRYKAHRLAMIYMGFDLTKNCEVDHIDGNRSNNKFSNLRIVNRQENMKNKSIGKNNTTGVLGVSVYGDKYRVRISLNGKRISLGLYNTIEEALSVRLKYEKEFGYCENHGRKKQ